jgi:hypothetical protein
MTCLFDAAFRDEVLNTRIHPSLHSKIVKPQKASEKSFLSTPHAYRH